VRYKGTTTKDRKFIYIHRKVWEEHHGPIPSGMQVHHINSDKHDNRIENLKLVSNAENMQKPDRFGKGYTLLKNKVRPYYAKRKIWGVSKSLGYFGTPCGAYMASMTAYL
jgi:hypothetical protein